MNKISSMEFIELIVDSSLTSLGSADIFAEIEIELRYGYYNYYTPCMPYHIAAI